MQVKVTYLTDGEIRFCNKLRAQQLVSEANALALGAFLQGPVEAPSREKFGVSSNTHNRLLKELVA